MRRYTFATWLVVVLSFAITALFILFAVWRVSTPTGGAQVEPGFTGAWQPDGVVIEPMDAESSFQSKDKVTAIDGKPIAQVIRGLVTGAVVRPLREGEPRVYTLVRDGQTLDVTVVPRPYPLSVFLANSWGMLAITLTSLAVSIAVFIRRPTQILVRAMLIWAQGLWGLVAYAVGLHISDLLEPGRYWLWAFVTLGGIVLFSIGLARFAEVFAPPASSWLQRLNQPRIVVVTYVVPFVAYALFIVVTWFTSSNALVWLSGWTPFGALITLVYSIIFLVVLLFSYRSTTDPDMRNRIRLVVFGGAVSGIGGVLLSAIPLVVFRRTIVPINVLGLFGLPFSLAIGFAIIRYRLVDVDFVINRTLVFGAISLVFAVFYFGILIAFQSLFDPFISDQQGLEIVTVISTLIAVALFNPLRSVVQRWIDRRFYRNKYAAEQAFAAFASQARSQVDIDKLTSDLRNTVAGAMDAEHVSVWVRGRQE